MDRTSSQRVARYVAEPVVLLEQSLTLWWALLVLGSPLSQTAWALGWLLPTTPLTLLCRAYGE